MAITMGLAMVPVLALAGGAVDYARLSSARADLQHASDAAALSAAGGEDGLEDENARQVFLSNAYGSTAGAIVDVNVETADRVRVDAKMDVTTPFFSLVGTETVTVGAFSVAMTRTGMEEFEESYTDIETSYGAACMLALSENSGNALLVNSPANVQGNECEVHVRSHANDAFMFNSSTVFNAEKFCVEGTATVRGSTSGEIQTGCRAAQDQLAGTLPVPQVGGCTYSNFTPDVSSNIVLTPGTYCGWANFNGSPTITLMPGLYVIKDGGWNMNTGTTVRGDGVSFYFAGSGATIQMNGNMSWDVSAPQSGAYEGILYFQDPSLPSSNFIFNGQNGQHLEGLIYLPTQNIQFKSKSLSGTTDRLSVVANTIMVTGEAEWRFRPMDQWQIAGTATHTEVTRTRTVQRSTGPGAPLLVQ